jgi:RHS repeat-associated protein
VSAYCSGSVIPTPGHREFSPLTGVWSSRIYVGKSAVIVRQPNGTRRVDYLLNDRLGSVDTVTDANALVKEKRGYDAFGKPRNGDWTDRVPPILGTASVNNTPKGFTQHEHLDAVKLINMNGRVYDYELGRFYSVDPFIQIPTNSQSANPYSYVLNNPLSGTDPTGFQSCFDPHRLCGRTVLYAALSRIRFSDNRPTRGVWATCSRGRISTVTCTERCSSYVATVCRRLMTASCTGMYSTQPGTTPPPCCLIRTSIAPERIGIEGQRISSRFRARFDG